MTPRERWLAKFEKLHGVSYPTLWWRLRRMKRRVKIPCTICGGSFLPYRENSRCCSPRCRQIDWRLRKKGLA